MGKVHACVKKASIKEEQTASESNVLKISTSRANLLTSSSILKGKDSVEKKERVVLRLRFLVLLAWYLLDCLDFVPLCLTSTAEMSKAPFSSR